MAPGRSVPDDQGNEALALAGRSTRMGLCSTFWSRAGATRRPPSVGQASASQAAEAADPRASCDDRGQAGELQRRERRGDALGRKSEAQRFKQQSGEFAPADPTTRATDEALQVTWPGPTLPLRSR